jgi:hypothetical protein
MRRRRAPDGSPKLRQGQGRWITTNQPTARHTYNMTLVAGRRFPCCRTRNAGPSRRAQRGDDALGGRVCWYDFDAKAWTYSQVSAAQTPWHYAAAAVSIRFPEGSSSLAPTIRAGPVILGFTTRCGFHRYRSATT